MTENTKDVIIQRIDDLILRFEERFTQNSKEHEEVKARVDKTNGRVRLLEKFVWGIAGGMAVIAFLGLGGIRDFIANNSNAQASVISK